MATYLIDYENVNKDGLNGVSKLTENDHVVIFYSAKADRMTFGLHRRLNETRAKVEYKKVDVGGHNALDFQLATFLGYLISEDADEEYCVVSNDRGFEYLTGFWREPKYRVTLAREIATSAQAEERRSRRHQRESQHGGNAEKAEEITALQAYEEGNTSISERKAEKTDVMILDEERSSLPAVTQEKRSYTGRHRNNGSQGRQHFQPSWNRAKSSGRKNNDRGGSRSSSAREDSSEDSLIGEVRECLTGLDMTDSDNRTIASYVGRYKTKLGFNNALVRKFGTQKAGDIYRQIKPLIKDKKGSGGAVEKRTSAENEKLVKEIRGLVTGMDLSNEDYKEIAASVQKYKTKQGVNNAIVRRLGTQKAGMIYKMIKPLLKDKKGR